LRVHRKQRTEMVKRSVSITKANDDWLHKHSEINFSGFVNQLLSGYVESYKDLEKNMKVNGD